MRFSLRTLLIVMLLLGPLCAWGWAKYQARLAELEQQRVLRALLKDRWGSLGPSGSGDITSSCFIATVAKRDPALDLPVELIHLPADPYRAVTWDQLIDGVAKPAEPALQLPTD